MKRSRNESAFTIVEIVVGVLIIGILATILIPVLVKQADDAKVVKAKRELEEIANAEERSALDLGYYLRLYALDDVDKGDKIGLGDQTDISDGIADEDLNQFYKNPKQMFIKTTPTDQVLLNPTLSDELYQKLAADTTAESAYRWTGPYFNIHKDESTDETRQAIATQNPLESPRSIHDTPTDPWGNDYMLFTREGMILEPEGTIIANGDVGNLAAPVKYPDTQVFDRPVVLSLGPNGLPGNGDPTNALEYRFGKGDDLYRAFGY